MDDLHLYYFVVRRFPPKQGVCGRQLDDYCRKMLKSTTVRLHAIKDYTKFTEELFGGTN